MPSDPNASSWTQAYDLWSAEWRSRASVAYADLHATVEQSVKAGGDDLARLQATYIAYADLLTRARAELAGVAAALAVYRGADADQWRTTYNALTAIYNNLETGRHQPVSAAPSVQGLPLVVVVAGISVSIASVCFAVAYYPYAVSLVEQVRLQRAELDARVEASKDGRTLPKSTLPPPSEKDSSLLWLLGGAAGIGLGVFLYTRLGTSA